MGAAHAEHARLATEQQCELLDAMLYVGLPAADLRAGRFDRAEAMTDSD